MPKSTTNRKTPAWKKILAAMGFLLIAAIVVHTIVTRDIPPIDDSDLALRERQIDPSENPYPEIRDYILDPEDTSAIKMLRRAYLDTGNLDHSSLQSIAAEIDAQLIAFDQFSQMTDWKVNGPIGIYSVNFGLNWLLQINMLKRMEIESHIDRKETSEASEKALSLLRAGRAQQSSECQFLSHLVGLTIFQNGLSGCSNIIFSQEIDSPSLDELEEKFDELNFDTSGLENSLRVEYQMMAQHITDLVEGEAVYVNDDGTEVTNVKPPNRLLFKKNRTQKFFADAYRDMISEASLSRKAAPNAAYIRAAKMNGKRIELYLSGNPVGRSLFTVGIPTVRSIIDKNAMTRTNCNLVRLQIAMEHYRLEKGDWPDELDSLIPEFINSIPTDCMDGQPLRYNREELRIYSVGYDFVDSKGITAPDLLKPFEDRNESVIYLERKETP